MAEPKNSSSIPATTAMKEPKLYRIGLYSKLTILINGSLIAASLIIGWALWVTITRDAIDNYIKWFNDTQQVNSNLKINFNEISIIVFIISGLSLMLVVVPFIFLKTKNGISTIFGLISFIFTAIFIIFLFVFFIFRFKTFTFLANKEDGEITNTTGNFIITFLPWMLAVLFALLVLIHSLWLTINITSKYKSNALLMPVAKPEKIKQETLIVKQEADNTITLPDMMSVSKNQEPSSTMPETNTNLQQEKIVSNPQTETVHYTNHELEAVPMQGAYHAEAVPPTEGALNNHKPTSNSSEEEETSISSQSKAEAITDTATNVKIDTNYQPQNQGGFDIKDNSEPEIEPAAHLNEVATPLATSTTQQTPESAPIATKLKIKNTKPAMPAPKVTKHHWTLEQIETAWEKAEIIDGVSNKLYRKDYAGAWIFHDAFTTDYAAADNIETYSWTIVLHRPIGQQGTTELYNLDPMNIVNAKSKGENYPSWKTKISSKGNKNIIKEQNWKART
ncbi:hypothetical protein [Spiroplasma endosymbiont of Polydrusus pterygomalis]|uniref:hypothetical protein n=1 Tax=Spiroplasma endosymbiont of Polydrusus pterygomalis TaxID=3139327 RepID=UPI003CCB2FA4